MISAWGSSIALCGGKCKCSVKRNCCTARKADSPDCIATKQEVTPAQPQGEIWSYAQDSFPPPFFLSFLLHSEFSCPCKFPPLSCLHWKEETFRRRIRTISFKPPPPLTECTKFVLKLNNRKCIWMGKLRFSSKFHYKRFQRCLVLTHPIFSNTPQ